jgi:cell division protein FtsB
MLSSVPCEAKMSIVSDVLDEEPREKEQRLEAEIARLQDAKRRALAIADERSKENVELRKENVDLRAEVAWLHAMLRNAA